MAESTLEVGVRVNPEDGIAYFGLDAVNEFLAAGRRIREIRAGGVVMLKAPGDDGEAVSVSFGGAQFEVVFEDH